MQKLELSLSCTNPSMYIFYGMLSLICSPTLYPISLNHCLKLKAKMSVCIHNFISNYLLIYAINSTLVNTLRPRQNGRHVPDNIFKYIFLNENVWTSIKIPMKFVPKGPINNIPALFQIMAWCRPGDKPLSETMMVTLLTHICITGPHWVNLIYLLKGSWNCLIDASNPLM